MDIQTILLNLKIDQLNAMQEASIDAWKEGSDLILLSPTGSGKTLAYLLPLVSSLKKGVEGVQAVVLVPSRGATKTACSRSPARTSTPRASRSSSGPWKTRCLPT